LYQNDLIYQPMSDFDLSQLLSVQHKLFFY